jgi:hypothetical protein
MRGGRLLTVVGVGHAEDVRKCPVLPVSAMALEQSGGIGGASEGGPVIDRQEVDNTVGLLFNFWLISSGSPRHQRGVEGGFQTVRSLRMFWMLGQPPWRFARVAVLQ